MSYAKARPEMQLKTKTVIRIDLRHLLEKAQVIKMITIPSVALGCCTSFHKIGVEVFCEIRCAQAQIRTKIVISMDL